LLGALGVIETLATNDWLTVDMLLSPNPWEPIKYDGFPKGTVLFVTGGHWQWTFDWGPNGQTPIEGLFEKVDTWLFPSQIGEPFVYTSLGGGYAVSAASEHPDAAFEYVKHVLDPAVTCENSQAVDHVWGPTARDDVAGMCEYFRTAVNGKLASASGDMKVGRSMRSYVGEGKISDEVARVTESIITGKATAEEAMEQFAKEMRESLGEDAVKEL
jgi:multiple sugar transport system substrate-binding protein